MELPIFECVGRYWVSRSALTNWLQEVPRINVKSHVNWKFTSQYTGLNKGWQFSVPFIKEFEYVEVLHDNKLSTSYRFIENDVKFPLCMYSILPNRHVCAFISDKVCLLILIEAKRQTLPEINVYTRLFGSIEYLMHF